MFCFKVEIGNHNNKRKFILYKLAIFASFGGRKPKIEAGMNAIRALELLRSHARARAWWAA